MKTTRMDWLLSRDDLPKLNDDGRLNDVNVASGSMMVPTDEDGFVEKTEVAGLVVQALGWTEREIDIDDEDTGLVLRPKWPGGDSLALYVGFADENDE